MIHFFPPCVATAGLPESPLQESLPACPPVQMMLSKLIQLFDTALGSAALHCDCDARSNVTLRRIFEVPIVVLVLPHPMSSTLVPAVLDTTVLLVRPSTLAYSVTGA